jgi:flagellar motor switch protein FliG
MDDVFKLKNSFKPSKDELFFNMASPKAAEILRKETAGTNKFSRRSTI